MEQHFLEGIDTIILRVSDIQRSKTWYVEKLGLTSVHEDSVLKLVVLDTYSPTSLTIWETTDAIAPNPKTSAYPIFRAQSAKAAHEELQKRQVRVGELTTDHVVTYFNFFDPDNNMLEVCQVHS